MQALKAFASNFLKHLMTIAMDFGTKVSLIVPNSLVYGSGYPHDCIRTTSALLSPGQDLRKEGIEGCIAFLRVTALVRWVAGR